MVTRTDCAGDQCIKIKTIDMFGDTMINRHFKHLIEIAIINLPIPTNADQIPAHHTFDCQWIKGIQQSLHILLVIIATLQEVEKTTNGHICNCEETVELNTETFIEFFFCILLRVQFAQGEGMLQQDCKPGLKQGRILRFRNLSHSTFQEQ